MQLSLKSFIIMLPFALAAGLPAACGGKVVVDVGGSGGTSGSANTTGKSNTTVASTSSGVPACSCDQFCSIMLDCGYSTKDCVDFACTQIPMDTQQCVCTQAPVVGCNFLDTCFPSSGTSGSGGGAASDACLQCATEQSMGKCVDLYMTCESNADCLNLLNCTVNCKFTDACIDQCFANNPYGNAEFVPLAHCAFCGTCSNPCQDSGAIWFCEAPPPP